MNNVTYLPQEGKKLSSTYNQIPATLKFDTLRIIFMDWSNKLTPSEFMVLMFIWQRTIWFGKYEEHIKHRHMLKGIEDVIGPLPFKERRLQQIINSLVKKGVVYRRTVTHGCWYAINFGWEGKKVHRKRIKRKKPMKIK